MLWIKDVIEWVKAKGLCHEIHMGWMRFLPERGDSEIIVYYDAASGRVVNIEGSIIEERRS